MSPVYVLVFSSVRTGPFGRDIVTERRVQSPSWHTLHTISGPLEDAGYTCMIFEQQSNNTLGPVGATPAYCPHCLKDYGRGHHTCDCPTEDDCDECGGMGHTIGFEGPKEIKYPCETCEEGAA